MPFESVITPNAPQLQSSVSLTLLLAAVPNVKLAGLNATLSVPPPDLGRVTESRRSPVPFWPVQPPYVSPQITV